MSTYLPQNGLPLENLQNGAPPKKRLKDAVAAQGIAAKLWEASKQRNAKNAAIQGQFDGNPPYSPTKMKASGRAGEANFNTLEAKSLLSSALVPYYDLFAGQARYIDIRTNVGNSEQRTHWSGVISEEYDRMLRKWRGFDYQMQSMQRDFVAFGKGYLMWDDERSWRFTKIAHYRLLVPDGTSIDLDKLEMFVVLRDWKVHELYGKIKDEKVARDAGWNVAEVKKAIAGAVPVDPSNNEDSIASQAMLRDNDLYVSARSSTVQTATVFVREFNGKWSEQMVRRDAITDGLAAQKDQPQWLFEAIGKYDNVNSVLNPFFYEVLDGSWNGATGLGRDIFVLMQLKDRLACTQANAVMLRNSLLLQPRTALDKSRLNLMQVGPITWVPDGVDVLQSVMLGDISSTVEVSRELSIQVEKNTGIYRPTLEKTKGNPDTLGEFQAKFAQAMVLSSSAVTRFYSQLDRLYEEQFKRVCAAAKLPASLGDWVKDAKEFKDRCLERGIPKEALDDIDTIRSWRTLGNGSAGLRMQTLSSLMGMYQLLPADGQQNLLEDVVSAQTSQSQMERYIPETAREQLPTDDEAWAMLENAALKEGAPVTWTPSQNNVIHAQTHLQAGSQALQGLEQGLPPIEVLAFLDAIGQHTAIHIQRESQNPTNKEVVKVLAEQWGQLAKVADKLRQQIGQEMDQQGQVQQGAQQQMSKMDLDRMKIEGNLQLKREKEQQNMGMKQQKFEQDLSLKEARTLHDMKIKEAQQRVDEMIQGRDAAEKGR